MAARAPEGDLVTAGELGDWLGLTANRVHALGRDGVLPRSPEKRYPLRASVAAYCDHARSLAKGKAADNALAEEKVRLAREQADKIALQNAAARGELLDSREVANEWRSVVVDLRAAILAVPSRVASRLGFDRKETAALDSEIRDAMEAIADDR
ncbi:Phage DNA packaging protein, Nu1 subunit of terminase [Vannielia litorea]|uniref:Phage DNA packaging protein, Nu1 subunit of terminase n=1 Tax=Vannielia litorea TaxID=1217970 RepID=A0A1N6DUI7_9RHOB|nr:Phage DNA packaging protein, Nu1 subunit of terminase [Vannielia litorea]